MVSRLLNAGKSRILTATAFLVVLTSLADWLVGRNVSLAALYILPMMVGAIVLRPWQTAGLAIFCSYLRSCFDTSGSSAELVLRFVFAGSAYFLSGSFVTAIMRNQDLVIKHLDALQREQRLRHEAEEQLRIMAESSPAAILTIQGEGIVVAANAAANRLFLIPRSQTLQGKSIRKYLPVLADALMTEAPPAGLRTAAQCQGNRENGEIFLAHMWFSSYTTPEGPHVAAIVVDSSEEMREREEQGLSQLLAGNRIMAVALSHEVRNFCGALVQLSENLSQRHHLDLDPDLQGMVSLIGGLESLAALRLQPKSQEILDPVPLKEVLANLRIVIEPDWREMEGKILWDLPRAMPEVYAEPHGLLQAFLNLAHNSLRAVRNESLKQLRIAVLSDLQKVHVRFEDSGPGVLDPASLFQPFQAGAFGTGLGLYVSRSILRSYGGDLRFDPQPTGCCFVVELEAGRVER